MTWLDDINQAFGDGIKNIHGNELCAALQTTDQVKHILLSYLSPGRIAVRIGGGG